MFLEVFGSERSLSNKLFKSKGWDHPLLKLSIMKYIFLSVIFIFQVNVYSQFSVGFEIIPYSVHYGNGEGIKVNTNYLVNKSFGIQMNIGSLHYNWYGKRREFYTDLDGNPLYDFSTNVDIYTTQPYPLGGVVGPLDFKLFEEAGIKHFIPYSDYRRNIFLNLQMIHKYEWKYFGIRNHIGPTIGQSEFELTVVGFSGTITNELNNQSEEMWVQLEFEGRYLYLGLEESLFLYYPVKENFDIGITTGIQYIINKRYREDMKTFSIGIGLDVKI